MRHNQLVFLVDVRKLLVLVTSSRSHNFETQNAMPSILLLIPSIRYETDCGCYQQPFFFTMNPINGMFPKMNDNFHLFVQFLKNLHLLYRNSRIYQLQYSTSQLTSWITYSPTRILLICKTFSTTELYILVTFPDWTLFQRLWKQKNFLGFYGRTSNTSILCTTGTRKCIISPGNLEKCFFKSMIPITTRILSLLERRELFGTCQLDITRWERTSTIVTLFFTKSSAKTTQTKKKPSEALWSSSWKWRYLRVALNFIVAGHKKPTSSTYLTPSSTFTSCTCFFLKIWTKMIYVWSSKILQSMTYGLEGNATIWSTTELSNQLSFESETGNG